MDALKFWKTVVRDRVNLLEKLLVLFTDHKVRFCVIGGQAVNAYAEPVVSLDLDIVVATGQTRRPSKRQKDLADISRLI